MFGEKNFGQENLAASQEKMENEKMLEKATSALDKIVENAFSNKFNQNV